MQKTVREWFSGMTEPDRSTCLGNMLFSDYPTDSLRRAIFMGLDERANVQTMEVWHRAMRGFYDNYPFTTPTERQAAEALLKEYNDFVERKAKFVIPENTLTDFITSKYGKG